MAVRLESCHCVFLYRIENFTDFILNLHLSKYNISSFCLIKVLEAQMKVDLADKESLEARRAQQEEESRENSKLISEQKAVRKNNRLIIIIFT